MGITYGDHLIDSGYYDITPEQERERGYDCPCGGWDCSAMPGGPLYGCPYVSTGPDAAEGKLASDRFANTRRIARTIFIDGFGGTESAWDANLDRDSVNTPESIKVCWDAARALLNDRVEAEKCPKWRAFYNVSYPKLWGIETDDPAAVEAGLEIVVAPCMPEHAAKDIARAWNEKSADPARTLTPHQSGSTT